ncbi:MAG: hypothetical protein P8H97_04620 [Pseudomonadales bacterium]|nr:hypothetical protein [Pseudomonadales bacterium]
MLFILGLHRDGDHADRVTAFAEQTAPLASQAMMATDAPHRGRLLYGVALEGVPQYKSRRSPNI